MFLMVRYDSFAYFINLIRCYLFVHGCDSNLRATHGSVDHVGFAVPQSLHSMKYINHILSLCHLAHNAAGTKYSTAPTSISTKIRKILHTELRKYTNCFRSSLGWTNRIWLYLALNFIYDVFMKPSLNKMNINKRRSDVLQLTGNAQWFFPLPPPPPAATGRPEVSASRRSAWMQGPLCVLPNLGTETDEPWGILPVAGT